MESAQENGMTEALLVSNAVLWVLVVVLAVVVVALTRQIGLLHERIAPVGALAAERGPKVGEAAPELSLATLDGGGLQLGGAEHPRTLLFFLSPTCPVCKTLLPTLRRLADEMSVRVVYASDGPPNEHGEFVRSHELPRDAYVLSEDLGLRFEVAKLPYAVLIDADGIVRAKGLVNTREHLESLFEADERGVASIQAWLEQSRSAGATS
jgi:methylamine dehydrogenase accessory protein MauD